MSFLSFVHLYLLSPSLNFCFSQRKLPRCDFTHDQTYLFETRVGNDSDLWKSKHKTFADNQTKKICEKLSLSTFVLKERDAGCRRWSTASQEPWWIPFLHVQMTVDMGWAEFWAPLTVQIVVEVEGDGGEKAEGGQDVLLGSPGRKGPLGSWSLKSHHIFQTLPAQHPPQPLAQLGQCPSQSLCKRGELKQLNSLTWLRFYSSLFFSFRSEEVPAQQESLKLDWGASTAPWKCQSHQV